MPERDRALVTAIVYGVLRTRSRLDHVLERAARRRVGAIDRRVLEILRIALYQVLDLDRIPAAAAVNEAVAMARRHGRAQAAGFVNGVLRACCRDARVRERRLAEPRPPVSEGPRAWRDWLALETSFPPAFVDRVLRSRGAVEGEALLRASNQPAPVVLRPARRSGGSEALARILEAEGVTTKPSPVLPGALRTARGVPQRTAAFRRGLFYIQDEAAQMVTLLLEPLGEEATILDLCAAPGGKVLQAIDAAHPPRTVVAADRSPARLRTVGDNARRLGLRGVLAVATDARRPGLHARFDRVLLDAPCSGTGVIRRHPEIRWRRGEADIARLAVAQRQAMAAACDLLVPGGRLVYAVCSLEPEEGPEVLEATLRERPALRLVPADRLLPDSLARFVDPRGCLVTLPHRDDVDGFFACALTLC